MENYKRISNQDLFEVKNHYVGTSRNQGGTKTVLNHKNLIIL